MKKFIKKITISEEDIIAVQDYLNCNSNRSIQSVYDHIRSISVLKRSKVENLVFTYLYTNRKKLNIS